MSHFSYFRCYESYMSHRYINQYVKRKLITQEMQWSKNYGDAPTRSWVMSHLRILKFVKSKKLSKSMIRTFLKTNFSKNGKSVSNLITYPKISFQHAAERDLLQWKENGIQNRLTQNLIQNLTQILFKFF